MPERDLKKYLLKRVAELNGEARKVRWEGRNHAPDWRVMLPGHNPFWVELKARGKRPNVMQSRELLCMRLLGEAVGWANCEQDIDTLIATSKR